MTGKMLTRANPYLADEVGRIEKNDDGADRYTPCHETGKDDASFVESHLPSMHPFCSRQQGAGWRSEFDDVFGANAVQMLLSSVDDGW